MLSLKSLQFQHHNRPLSPHKAQYKAGPTFTFEALASVPKLPITLSQLALTSAIYLPAVPDKTVSHAKLPWLMILPKDGANSLALKSLAVKKLLAL